LHVAIARTMSRLIGYRSNRISPSMETAAAHLPSNRPVQRSRFLRSCPDPLCYDACVDVADSERWMLVRLRLSHPTDGVGGQGFLVPWSMLLYRTTSRSRELCWKTEQVSVYHLRLCNTESKDIPRTGRLYTAFACHTMALRPRMVVAWVGMSFWTR